MNNKNQVSIKKYLSKRLIFAIVTSVLFVVGIPITIFSAINHIWVLMVLGIVFIVFGFYGSPLIWVNYGSLRSLKNVVDAVMEENILTVPELAKQLQVKEGVVRQQLTTAIKKKYITGFIYDGNTLTLNEKTAPKRQVQINKSKCPFCGGTLEPTEKGYICPYCGSKLE